MSELTLHVERMSYGPDAIAHTPEGKTVFISGGAVPGDTVSVQITEDTDRFSRGQLVKILEASAFREPHPNPFVALTGATPWGNIIYEQQLIEKRNGVISALERIGRFSHDDVSELVKDIVSPGEPWGYRNKIELAFKRNGNKTLVGMYAPNGQDIVRIKDCPLLDKSNQKAVGAVSGALSYLSGSHDLDIERIGIRVSRRTRELEVALWTAPSGFPRTQVARVLGDAVNATSVVRVMTKGPSKARRVVGVERLSGSGSWSELIDGQKMQLSAPSFFQVNTKGAEKLVELVLSGLDVQPDDEAMDLYCGAGTFTLPLAKRAGFVSAVEAYGPAVRDLRRNLELARLDNVDAVGGDAGREFPDTDADVIIVDPPRAGLAPEVIQQLSKQPARAIAYVSCDPATLARDLKRFVEIGSYKPVSVTPVDLFPQTFHVENVCLLKRKKMIRKGRVNLLMKEERESPITLYTPSLEDLWFRQKMMADEETMSYNHAWGGTIPFPKETWHGWYDFWIVKHENKRYYRYLKDSGGHFIGEVAYHFDSDKNIYLADVIVYAPYRKMGYGSIGLNLLCDAAKQNGIKQLYDDIAIDNPSVTMFLKNGFVEEYRTSEIIMLKKEL